MVSKHLFIIFSSLVIAQTIQSMELENKEAITIQMDNQRPTEILTRHACALLNVHDKTSENAIRSLLKGSPNESPERTQERNSLLKKLSNSLDLK